jgi:hypothetical protein
VLSRNREKKQVQETEIGAEKGINIKYPVPRAQGFSSRVKRASGKTHSVHGFIFIIWNKKLYLQVGNGESVWESNPPDCLTIWGKTSELRFLLVLQE